jgi:hypothetical protein
MMSTGVGLGLGLIAGPTSILNTSVYKNVYTSRPDFLMRLPSTRKPRLTIHTKLIPVGMNL